MLALLVAATLTASPGSPSVTCSHCTLLAQVLIDERMELEHQLRLLRVGGGLQREAPPRMAVLFSF